MDPYIGEIRIFGFHFAPVDWAFCNGQPVAISQYQALYAILGTTFGGNGQTTFNLPNFQNTAPMHWGNGANLTPRTLGQAVGTPSVTLTQLQMAGHNHLVQSASGSTATQEIPTPGPTAWMGLSVPGKAYVDTTAPVNAQFSNKAIGNNGGSLPHNNMQPISTLNFCVCLNGIFPVRN